MSLVFLSIISSLLSKSPLHAFQELSLFVGLCYFSLLISYIFLLYKARMVLAISFALLLSATIYITGFFSGYAASIIEDIPLKWPEPFFGFSSVRFFNQYQIWGIPLLTLPLFLIKNLCPALRNTLLVLMSGWWVLFFASGSRGVIIAITTAFLAVWLVYRKQSLGFLKVQLTTLVGGLLIYTLLFFIVPELLSTDAGKLSQLRTGHADRMSLWTSAITMAVENPWFGVGPMHFAWYPNEFSLSHPHNSILQWAAEWGIPSALVVIGLFIYGVYQWIKCFNYKTLVSTDLDNTQISIALFCSFVAGMTYSLVSGVIVMPISQVLMATVIGLMLGVYRENSHINTSNMKIASSGSSVFTRLFAGIVLLTLVWAVLPDLVPRITGQEEFLSYSYKNVGPRFWQNGGIPH